MKVPVKGRHLYQVYGEYGGEFSNYKDAVKCARYASTTVEYNYESEIWVDGSVWYDKFKNGKLVRERV